MKAFLKKFAASFRRMLTPMILLAGVVSVFLIWYFLSQEEAKRFEGVISQYEELIRAYETGSMDRVQLREKMKLFISHWDDGLVAGVPPPHKIDDPERMPRSDLYVPYLGQSISDWHYRWIDRKRGELNFLIARLFVEQNEASEAPDIQMYREAISQLDKMSILDQDPIAAEDESARQNIYFGSDPNEPAEDKDLLGLSREGAKSGRDRVYRTLSEGWREVIQQNQVPAQEYWGYTEEPYFKRESVNLRMHIANKMFEMGAYADSWKQMSKVYEGAWDNYIEAFAIHLENEYDYRRGLLERKGVFKVESQPFTRSMSTSFDELDGEGGLRILPLIPSPETMLAPGMSCDISRTLDATLNFSMWVGSSPQNFVWSPFIDNPEVEGEKDGFLYRRWNNLRLAHLVPERERAAATEAFLTEWSHLSQLLLNMASINRYVQLQFTKNEADDRTKVRRLESQLHMRRRDYSYLLREEQMALGPDYLLPEELAPTLPFEVDSGVYLSDFELDQRRSAIRSRMKNAHDEAKTKFKELREARLVEVERSQGELPSNPPSYFIGSGRTLNREREPELWWRTRVDLLAQQIIIFDACVRLDEQIREMHRELPDVRSDRTEAPISKSRLSILDFVVFVSSRFDMFNARVSDLNDSYMLEHAYTGENADENNEALKTSLDDPERSFEGFRIRETQGEVYRKIGETGLGLEAVLATLGVTREAYDLTVKEIVRNRFINQENTPDELAEIFGLTSEEIAEATSKSGQSKQTAEEPDSGSPPEGSSDQSWDGLRPLVDAYATLRDSYPSIARDVRAKYRGIHTPSFAMSSASRGESPRKDVFKQALDQQHDRLRPEYAGIESIDDEILSKYELDLLRQFYDNFAEPKTLDNMTIKTPDRVVTEYYNTVVESRTTPGASEAFAKAYQNAFADYNSSFNDFLAWQEFRAELKRDIKTLERAKFMVSRRQFDVLADRSIAYLRDSNDVFETPSPDESISNRRDWARVIEQVAKDVIDDKVIPFIREKGLATREIVVQPGSFRPIGSAEEAAMFWGSFAIEGIPYEDAGEAIELFHRNLAIELADGGAYRDSGVILPPMLQDSRESEPLQSGFGFVVTTTLVAISALEKEEREILEEVDRLESNFSTLADSLDIETRKASQYYRGRTLMLDQKRIYDDIPQDDKADLRRQNEQALLDADASFRECYSGLSMHTQKDLIFAASIMRGRVSELLGKPQEAVELYNSSVITSEEKVIEENSYVDIAEWLAMLRFLRENELVLEAEVGRGELPEDVVAIEQLIELYTNLSEKLPKRQTGILLTLGDLSMAHGRMLRDLAESYLALGEQQLYEDTRTASEKAFILAGEVYSTIQERDNRLPKNQVLEALFYAGTAYKEGGAITEMVRVYNVYADVVNTFGVGFREDPNYAQVITDLGWGLIELGQYRRSVDYFKLVDEFNRKRGTGEVARATYDAYYLWPYAYQLLGEYDQALELYHKNILSSEAALIQPYSEQWKKASYQVGVIHSDRAFEAIAASGAAPIDLASRGSASVANEDARSKALEEFQQAGTWFGDLLSRGFPADDAYVIKTQFRLARVNLGKVGLLGETDKYIDIAQEFEAVAKLVERNESPEMRRLRRDSLIYLGDCYFLHAYNNPGPERESFYDLAIEGYRQISRLYSDDPWTLWAMSQIAEIEILRGRYEGARSVLGRAQSLAQNLPDESYAEFPKTRQKAFWLDYLDWKSRLPNAGSSG
ncbi:MAG: hypothetical protein NUW37_14240 [Planctomycetes bacterium]|nr:hypothetical protein [Planctomycetota bacterium]